MPPLVALARSSCRSHAWRWSGMRMQSVLDIPLQTTPWLPRGSPLQQGRLRSQQRWHRIIASGGGYAEQIAACEASSDWLQVVELLAEVRATKETLPWEALEPAVRVLARHGQSQRAVRIMEGAHAHADVSPATLSAVFSALLRESQPDAALSLLKEMDRHWEGRAEGERAMACNRTARACARGGRLDEGLQLLDSMQRAGLEVDPDTYEALALACLRDGRGQRAEELFEERDYC